MTRTGSHDGADRLGSAAWIAIVSAASVLFSLALACATPFAAIAAIAGARMPVRSAVLLTGFAWLANQLVGYLLLGYPTTWDSFAWGAAIGIAALLAAGAVLALRRVTSGFAALAGGLLAAFFAYEATLFAATALLPSGDEAFSLAVIARIFWTNLLALAGLLILHRLAVAIGLLIGEDARDSAARYA